MVITVSPERITDPIEPVRVGAATPASGSAIAAAPVLTLAADREALPLTVMADGEVELTFTNPAICSVAFPDRLSEAELDVFSTYTEVRTVCVSALEVLARKFPLPAYEAVIV